MESNSTSSSSSTQQILVSNSSPSGDEVNTVPDIEVIDLCSPTTFRSPVFSEEIVEIEDDPPATETRLGPIRSRRRNQNRDQPYVVPSTSKKQQEKVQIECPICLESVVNREPVSTICGHIYCKDCLVNSLKITTKKCPTCKKQLKGKNSFHPLYSL
jgi:endogenous inhibitor of DNA gyrase (YacG/DUF329 family)